MAAALTRWLSSPATPAWLAYALGGLAIHLLLWQYSEPPEIFSDFFKAYPHDVAVKETKSIGCGIKFRS